MNIAKNAAFWAGLQSLLAFFMSTMIITMMFMAFASDEFDTSPVKVVLLFTALQITLITCCSIHYKHKKSQLEQPR